MDGTEYAGALSQRVFQTVASAADDMAAVFADDTPELSSLFVVWALQVRTQHFRAFRSQRTAAPCISQGLVVACWCALFRQLTPLVSIFLLHQLSCAAEHQSAVLSQLQHTSAVSMHLSMWLSPRQR